MSLYTHWACFHCRKSFHNPPSKMTRKCLECGDSMIDMGVYFEPPRKQAVNQWKVMQLLAESGYKFQTEGNKAYIDWAILRAKRPRIADVKEIIESEKEAEFKNKQKERIKFFKESKHK